MDAFANYKVSVGKIARTLLYEDAKGTIRFAFDFDLPENPNVLILERHKIESSNEEEQLRFNSAFERTKQYLLSKGHKVKVWPDEFKNG
jgi:hypothetical protein